MSGESAWLDRLSEAEQSPWLVADRWRSAGGRVIGLFGYQAPRELVAAAGMLPVLLTGADLGSQAPASSPPERAGSDVKAVVDGLSGELSPDALALLEGLVAGRLSWIDGLLIGRDDEAHTKLFYTLREMSQDSELAPSVPALGFADIVRLPQRTSARYNRARLAQLRDLMAEWAQREVDDEALCSAIAEDLRTQQLLRSLRQLRDDGRATAAEVLTAELAARRLPADAAHEALAGAHAAAERRPVRPIAARVFVTGSRPEVETYRLLEAQGIAIVGDDHEWGAAPGDLDRCAGNPLDWLADRYQFSPVGAARSGLDRVEVVVARVHALGACAVLQLILPGDEASAWERAELQARLDPLPVISLELQPGARDEPLHGAAVQLRACAGARDATSEPAGGQAP